MGRILRDFAASRRRLSAVFLSIGEAMPSNSTPQLRRIPQKSVRRKLGWNDWTTAEKWTGGPGFVSGLLACICGFVWAGQGGTVDAGAFIPMCVFGGIALVGITAWVFIRNWHSWFSCCYTTVPVWSELNCKMIT